VVTGEKLATAEAYENRNRPARASRHPNLLRFSVVATLLPVMLVHRRTNRVLRAFGEAEDLARFSRAD